MTVDASSVRFYAASCDGFTTLGEFDNLLGALRRAWKEGKESGNTAKMADAAAWGAFVKEERQKIADRLEEDVDAAYVAACASIQARTAQDTIRTVTTPQAATQAIADGIYTIVFDGNEDDYLTIRIVKHWDEANAARGERVVKYLRGSDNESDYQGCAFVTPDGSLRMWGRFKGGAFAARLGEAWEILTRGNDDDRADARLAYAKRSSRCARCNRTLTVPASLHRGLGPECATKI